MIQKKEEKSTNIIFVNYIPLITKYYCWVNKSMRNDKKKKIDKTSILVLKDEVGGLERKERKQKKITFMTKKHFAFHLNFEIDR